MFSLCVIDPFKMKAWSSPRKSLMLVLGLMVLSGVSSSPALWTYEIYPNPGYHSGKSCLFLIDNFTMAWINVFIVSNVSKLYPVILLTIFTIMLILKLMKISKDRKALSSVQDNKKEMEAAVIMVFLGVVQCALYIPAGVFAALYFGYAILAYFSIQTSINLAFLFLALDRTFLSLTIVCHLYNLYIYMIKIPSFRNDMKMCKAKPNSN